MKRRNTVVRRGEKTLVSESHSHLRRIGWPAPTTKTMAFSDFRGRERKSENMRINGYKNSDKGNRSLHTTNTSSPNPNHPSSLYPSLCPKPTLPPTFAIKDILVTSWTTISLWTVSFFTHSHHPVPASERPRTLPLLKRELKARFFIFTICLILKCRV